MAWIVLVCCFSFSSAITLYNNARFQPNNINLILSNISQVYSQLNCACLCFANTTCLTATYYGTIQHCILFSAPLEYGTLKLVTTNEMTSVLSIKNRTLPTSSILNNMNNIIYGIWNTTAGSNSYPSFAGSSVGNYFPGQGAAQAFDGNVTTKYVNFGFCNSTTGVYNSQCGNNTGLYIWLQQGPTLLTNFRFCTPNSYPERDPLLVTIEGSNEPLALLTLGSSWKLIYNDSAGLDIDPGRYTWGITQRLTNNSIWYRSYRILIVSKRYEGQFVQYSEIELFGY